MPLKLEVGDELTLKKPHPCGKKSFKVLRTGADFRIQCLGCDHQIWLPRRELERRIIEINGEKKVK